MQEAPELGSEPLRRFDTADMADTVQDDELRVREGGVQRGRDGQRCPRVLVAVQEQHRDVDRRQRIAQVAFR